MSNKLGFQMNPRIFRFLAYLFSRSGRWIFRIPTPMGMSVSDVNLCINQGLVRKKGFNRRREGCHETFRIGLRITKKGKALLISHFLEWLKNYSLGSD